jgi:hypothetical protein
MGCSCGIQILKWSGFGIGPATPGSNSTEKKVKPNKASRHFWDGITSNIVVPIR